MKKAKFYTLNQKNGKEFACLVTGWETEHFNYYKNNGWYAIEKDCGLMVCSPGRTLKETRENAERTEIFEQIEKAKKLPRNMKYCEIFQKLSEQAKAQ